MYEFLFAAIIVFVASILQTTTGFGFAVVATPLLLIVLNSRDCIQISLVISFFIALALLPKILYEVNVDIVKRFLLGSIFGIPIGLFIFKYCSLEVLKLIVSAVVLTITVFMLYNQYRNKDHEVNHETIKEKESKSDRISQLMVGFFSGVFTISIGMPGVPPAIYFVTTNTSKEVTRSTTLAFFIIVYIIGFVVQLFTVGINHEVWVYSLQLGPAAAIGVLIGNKFFPKINQKNFQIIANGVLIYTGFYMLFTSIL